MKLYCPECKSTYEDETLERCPKDDSRLFTLDASNDDPLLGAIIDGRFRVERLLGRGGMGAVYRGIQLSVGREVAVKVLRSELIDREVALERFYRESKIISGLSHPNIVRLIDFGQDRERDLLYLVMELVNGFNMGDLLERGRMRVALALEIAYQVCGALTEPHKLGVVHRDLKPDNLLVVPVSDGTIQVKVLDFGIARALETNTQLTATGMVCGTPQYMAPEQAQNQDIGPGTDLYALGVILYEMLCGIPPFRGQNSLQVMLQQIQIAPAPLKKYLPPSALPIEVEDLVHDLLSKDVNGRPSSALEVRKRIDHIRKLYGLDPVRIDPDAPRERMFDELILDKMPGIGEGTGRGYTEALRRETGLNKQEGSTHSTGEEAAFADTECAPTVGTDEFGSTVPVKAAARVEISADANRRARGVTSDGPAKPWTPVAQRGVGAFAEPARTSAQVPPSIHTPEGVIAPNTGERYVAAPVGSATLTHTHQTPAATVGSNKILIAALGVMVLAIIAAAGVIVAIAIGGDEGGSEAPPVAAQEPDRDVPVTDGDEAKPVVGKPTEGRAIDAAPDPSEGKSAAEGVDGDEVEETDDGAKEEPVKAAKKKKGTSSKKSAKNGKTYKSTDAVKKLGDISVPERRRPTEKAPPAHVLFDDAPVIKKEPPKKKPLEKVDKPKGLGGLNGMLKGKNQDDKKDDKVEKARGMFERK